MTMPTLLQFFNDPILRAPSIGSMLMCLASSLIGVIAFVKKRSLIGEALSHATYPGVILGILMSALFFNLNHPFAFLFVSVGAALSSWLGLIIIEKCEKRIHLHPDAALCLIISVFLGIGLTFASQVQITHPVWYRQSQTFLFGQAATMGDHHIGIYAVFSLIVISLIVFRFRQIELIYFDSAFTESLGISTHFFHFLSHFFLILVLIIGMRSVGIVLMSGMLIAPVAFAHQLTDRLGKMFLISAVVGVLSGFLGVYLSVCLPFFLSKTPSSFCLPTGPMILLVAVFLTFLSLLFAPKRGFVFRLFRIHRFRLKQQMDHLLKALWKKERLNLGELQSELGLSRLLLCYLLFFSKKRGWTLRETEISLTPSGKRQGAYLVRLHRLWELYLTSQLNVKEERVHQSAEEMEHILTPEIEEKLTDLLKNPERDPHQKIIPKREGV